MSEGRARDRSRLPGTVGVGAGTVLAAAQGTAARNAGARFVVCPHTDLLVIITAIGSALAPVLASRRRPNFSGGAAQVNTLSLG